MRIIEHENITDWGVNYILMEEHGYTACNLYIYNDAPYDSYISCLNVIEAERHKGLGSQLLNAALQKAREKGMERCVLSCKENSWVHDWYRRLGFYDMYNDDENHELIWMRKDLT